MRHALFGELLSRHVALSDHDISEILTDQAISHRRFGEIAMAFQWVRPQHVWQAWWAQLEESTQQIALPDVGVDTQALGSVPRRLAEEYGVIPIRVYGDQLVLAASEASRPRAGEELPHMLHKSLRFVLASDDQIRNAIQSYYASESN